MKMTQGYIDDYVLKPIIKRLDELETLIKNNDKNIKMKIGWMSDNIAKIPKKKR